MYDVGEGGAATPVVAERSATGLKERYDGIVKRIEEAKFTGAGDEKKVRGGWRPCVGRSGHAAGGSAGVAGGAVGAAAVGRGGGGGEGRGRRSEGEVAAVGADEAGWPPRAQVVALCREYITKIGNAVAAATPKKTGEGVYEGECNEAG